jgi:hypothetical protein
MGKGEDGSPVAQVSYQVTIRDIRYGDILDVMQDAVENLLVMVSYSLDAANYALRDHRGCPGG